MNALLRPVFIAIVLLFTQFQLWADLDAGEFAGYVRAGAGVSHQGGPENCYYLGNGDGHGYRLGNECDTYIELGYARTIAQADDGLKFTGYAMLNDYSSTSGVGATPQLAQLFIQASGLDALGGSRLWIGERYYGRQDIYSMDLQYINLDGVGAGMDRWPVPIGGNLSYAVFKDNDTNNIPPNGSVMIHDSNSAIRQDLLYRDIPLHALGTLDVIAGWILPASPRTETRRHSGYNLHLFDHQHSSWGWNTFGIQFGVGPGTGRGDPGVYQTATPYAAFTSVPDASAPDALCCNRMGQSGSTLLGSADRRLRFFEYLILQPNEHFAASFDILHQADQSPVYGGSSRWDSIGIRPEYIVARHFKVQMEVARDRVAYPGAPVEWLAKYTIAPTLSLGRGFLDRPEMRWYFTYAHWNQAAIATISANNNAGPLGATRSDFSTGLQVETWWGSSWY